mgnify:CR=1 FL=1
MMPRAMSETPRVGLLGSGRGTNFQALLDAQRRGALDCRFAVVLSDVRDAPILDLARQAGIPCEHVPPGPRRSRLSDEAEARFVASLRQHQVDWVVLAGFMRLVGPGLIDAFPGRIINVHPSLLPKFRGLEAWRQALEAGETRTGCTVHYVEAGMDTGTVIAQAEVPIEPGDTPEALHARIQLAEHQLLPATLQKLLSQP